MSTPQIFTQPRLLSTDENDPDEPLGGTPTPTPTPTPMPRRGTGAAAPARKAPEQWPRDSNEVSFARQIQGVVSHKNEDYILPPPPPEDDSVRAGQGPRLHYFAPRVQSAVLAELQRVGRGEDDFHDLLEDTRVRTVLANLVAHIILINSNISGRFATLQQNAGILMTLASADRRRLQALLQQNNRFGDLRVNFRDLM